MENEVLEALKSIMEDMKNLKDDINDLKKDVKYLKEDTSKNGILIEKMDGNIKIIAEGHNSLLESFSNNFSKLTKDENDRFNIVENAINKNSIDIQENGEKIQEINENMLFIKQLTLENSLEVTKIQRLKTIK